MVGEGADTQASCSPSWPRPCPPGDKGLILLQHSPPAGYPPCCGDWRGCADLHRCPGPRQPRAPPSHRITRTNSYGLMCKKTIAP